MGRIYRLEPEIRSADDGCGQADRVKRMINARVGSIPYEERLWTTISITGRAACHYHELATKLIVDEAHTFRGRRKSITLMSIVDQVTRIHKSDQKEKNVEEAKGAGPKVVFF